MNNFSAHLLSYYHFLRLEALTLVMVISCQDRRMQRQLRQAQGSMIFVVCTQRAPGKDRQVMQKPPERHLIIIQNYSLVKAWCQFKDYWCGSLLNYCCSTRGMHTPQLLDLHSQELESIRRLFEEADQDGSGTLEKSEFIEILSDPVVQATLTRRLGTHRVIA